MFSFKLENIKNDEKIKIILETVFCDTEKNDTILIRYWSFFKTQIYIFSKNKYNINVSWVIHISDDKLDYIQKIKDIIQLLRIKNIYINTYKHSNYVNSKTNLSIDKQKKPNLFSPFYEVLFNNFLKKLPENFEEDSFIIRLGLDDDDFLSNHHYLKIVNVIQKYKKQIRFSDELYFGFTECNIVYYKINGSIQLKQQILHRIMTGNRFVASYSKIPSTSPFSLTEDFLNQDNRYVTVESNAPTFYYNRHGNNLSNNSKDHHAKSDLLEIEFKNHLELLNHIINDI